MHALVAGWFSFENMGTTAGDLISKDIVCDWLREAGVSFDVALTSQFADAGAVDIYQADPNKYTDLVFVCGPFGNGWPVTDMLTRYSNCRMTGVNLSMLQPTSEWNPFTLLYERDDFTTSFPDIVFYGRKKRVPVVGLILAHKQKEYGKNSLHERANQSFEELIARTEMSVVHIDTALEKNAGGLRTAAEVETLIAAMDVVLTTRLHGTVLALKNAVPVIPIDPVAGGAKITLQVKSIGWPILFGADNVESVEMDKAFRYCLTEEATVKSAECAVRAIEITAERKRKFISDFVKLK